jgi:hypothetical protein
MQDFISEDDLRTFEGWLKYQVGDAALTSDELETWRGIYEECQPASPVGLMNFKPLRPDEYRYAVALRDGPDLWLTLWIKRDPKGDVYVLVPRADGGWDAHTSYHRNGRFHVKSFGKAFAIKQLQPLTDAFRGTEHLGLYAGHSPKKLGAICDPAAFSGVTEFGPGVLGPIHGSVAVDLIQPGCEPMDLMNPIVDRRDFDHAFPSLAIRICGDVTLPKDSA